MVSAFAPPLASAARYAATVSSEARAAARAEAEEVAPAGGVGADRGSRLGSAGVVLHALVDDGGEAPDEASSCVARATSTAVIVSRIPGSQRLPAKAGSLPVEPC